MIFSATCKSPRYLRYHFLRLILSANPFYHIHYLRYIISSNINLQPKPTKPKLLYCISTLKSRQVSLDQAGNRHAGLNPKFYKELEIEWHVTLKKYSSPWQDTPTGMHRIYRLVLITNSNFMRTSTPRYDYLT
jgi:hypothetical protein